jgi:GAF domain-containing protein
VKRRSRAGGTPVKTRRRKAATPKRRNAPKAVRRHSSSAADQETKVARLTRELHEALEQQTATAEVLQVINASAGDLVPVFDAMLEKAMSLCGASFGGLWIRDGDFARAAAARNMPRPFVEFLTREPVPMTKVFGHSFHDRRFLQIADLPATEAYRNRLPVTVAGVELGGIRTFLGVPLRKDGSLVGIFAIYRQEVRPFSDKQIALLENFASQAVIAMENVRLINETQEALEQQKASGEVLSVISSSVADTAPVFDRILDSCERLVAFERAAIFVVDAEDQVQLATARGQRGESVTRALHAMFPQPLARTPMHRAFSEGRVVIFTDVANDADAPWTLRTAATKIGSFSVVVAPMLWEGRGIGAIHLSRAAHATFTEKEVALLKTFADQAVIAIQNARLFNETKEALEQQTATSEVLHVISSSPGELEPVFKAMLENATRICEAKFGTLYLRDADAYRAVAIHNAPPAYVEARKRDLVRPPPDSALGQIANTRKVAHVADITAVKSYIERDPYLVAAVELGGYRTIVAVPMLKDNELIGAITICRQAVQPFSDKQIALLTNFAAQAVIAIENTRLLKELTKLNQQLEQRVADQVGEIERMGRLRRFLPPQVADLIVASGTEKQLESHRREITALFCDLRGFTGFSESSDPEDVMALLRDYHAAIGETIIKYSGTLERYAGDGVMVVFNDPVPVEKPALQAVLMALEMRDVIGALTERWRRLGHDIGFGIGIAHGFATLGTIGFEGRFDYAAIGTVSNVASRLCDEAKPGQILISPRVLMAVEDAVTVEPVGEFALKGIRRPLAAYNVLATNREN